MGRSPILVLDSDTGASKDMINRQSSGSAQIHKRWGLITRNLLLTQKGKPVVFEPVDPECRVSLKPLSAFRKEAVNKTLLADAEVS